MNRKSLFVVATLWIMSLVCVGVWAQGQGQIAPGQRPGEPVGDVITGENIGFQRVVAQPTRDGAVAGRWMVRIDGRWRPTEAPIAVVR